MEKETLGSCKILEPSRTINKQNEFEGRLCRIRCAGYSIEQKRLVKKIIQKQRHLRYGYISLSTCRKYINK